MLGLGLVHGSLPVLFALRQQIVNEFRIKTSLLLYRAITEKYNTPYLLKSAFERCEASEREKMLVGLPYESGRKKVPASVAKVIALLFNEPELK